MADPLESIRKSCEAINNTQFAGPGIFTNAILSKPEVTTLIRDALPAEQALYHIAKAKGSGQQQNRGAHVPATPSRSSDPSLSTELIPERTDGNSVYVLESVTEGAQSHQPAVRVPRLAPSAVSDSEELLSPLKLRAVSRGGGSSSLALTNNDVPAMCAAVTDVLDQHPSTEHSEVVRSDVAALSKMYDELLAEVGELEKRVAGQKQSLDQYNEELNELSPSRSNFAPRKTLSVDELLLREEEEVQHLEEQLSQQHGA